MIWVTRAELKDKYKVFVEFNDGTSGIIDFEDKLNNEHQTGDIFIINMYPYGNRSSNEGYFIMLRYTSSTAYEWYCFASAYSL
jgi:hypothetical protein